MKIICRLIDRLTFDTFGVKVGSSAIAAHDEHVVSSPFGFPDDDTGGSGGIGVMSPDLFSNVVSLLKSSLIRSSFTVDVSSCP